MKVLTQDFAATKVLWFDSIVKASADNERQTEERKDMLIEEEE